MYSVLVACTHSHTHTYTHTHSEETPNKKIMRRGRKLFNNKPSEVREKSTVNTFHDIIVEVDKFPVEARMCHHVPLLVV